jgi:hypothetical protein
MDRDKSISITTPNSTPSPLPLHRKPSLKVVLMIAKDPGLLPLLLSMLQSQYPQETHEKGVYFSVENCRFDLRTALLSDIRKILSDANLAKVVLFFFDLQDKTALRETKDAANALKVAIRMDAQRYLVGYNAGKEKDETQKVTEVASLLGFLYMEIPFPQQSNLQLLQSMQK